MTASTTVAVNAKTLVTTTSGQKYCLGAASSAGRKKAIAPTAMATPRNRPKPFIRYLGFTPSKTGPSYVLPGAMNEPKKSAVTKPANRAAAAARSEMVMGRAVLQRIGPKTKIIVLHGRQ